MPHSGNQWNCRRRRRPHHDFLVKPPQILQRPTAPRHDDQVGARNYPPRYNRPPCRNSVEPCNRRRHITRTRLPLHRHRPDQHMARKAVPEPVQNIPDHRARRRSYHPDHPRQIRQRLLAALIKQPLRRQRRTPPLQHRHQRARACWRHIFHNQLILRLPRKRGHPPGRDNFHPFLRPHLHLGDLAFPADRGNHRPVILQIEIQMPRGWL